MASKRVMHLLYVRPHSRAYPALMCFMDLDDHRSLVMMILLSNQDLQRH